MVIVSGRLCNWPNKIAEARRGRSWAKKPRSEEKSATTGGYNDNGKFEAAERSKLRLWLVIVSNALSDVLYSPGAGGWSSSNATGNQPNGWNDGGSVSEKLRRYLIAGSFSR